MERKKILIVEDEKNIAKLLAFNLGAAGYDHAVAADGQAGLDMALTGDYDLILLDLMLPKMDGFEVCRRVRKVSNVPIIIVTAREEEVDKVMGLDIGADDYVTKPYSIKELLARVKANIRRSSSEPVAVSAAEEKPKEEKKAENVLRIRELEIDLERYVVSKNGTEIPLTKIEYDLLVYLARQQGKVCTREELLEKVWGYDGFFGDTRNVDVTVSRLREKLETDAAAPEYFFTRRGVGYYVV